MYPCKKVHTYQWPRSISVSNLHTISYLAQASGLYWHKLSVTISTYFIPSCTPLMSSSLIWWSKLLSMKGCGNNIFAGPENGKRDYLAFYRFTFLNRHHSCLIGTKPHRFIWHCKHYNFTVTDLNNNAFGFCFTTLSLFYCATVSANSYDFVLCMTEYQSNDINITIKTYAPVHNCFN